MTMDDESRAMMARIDERTQMILERLKSGDEKMVGYDKAFQSLPCKEVKEQLRNHDRMIWTAFTAIAGLAMKAFWGVLPK